MMKLSVIIINRLIKKLLLKKLQCKINHHNDTVIYLLIFIETQMVIYQTSLVLFGGIGCEQNLTWAKLSFNPQGLLQPKR